MKRCFMLSLFFLTFFSGEAVSSSPVKEQAKVYREEGYKLQSQGDLRGALSFYLKAIQIDPSFKEAYNDLGIVYEGLGDLDRAEAMYLKALEIDSHYSAPYANLGFLYEKKNQPRKAIFYWKKRYKLAEKGDYWREKARQHLLKLGAFEEIRREELEKKAAQLSQEVISEREQERLKKLEKAKLHFDLGFKALTKHSYKEAEKEFAEVLKLNPPDKDLISKAEEYHKTAKEEALKENIEDHLENSLNYLKEGDYLSLIQELRKAINSVPKIFRK